MFQPGHRVLGIFSILNVIVVLAQASTLSGETQCPSQAIEQEEDDFSLIQADHSKPLGAIRQDRVQERSQSVKDKVLKEPSAVESTEATTNRPLLSMLALSPSTAIAVGPEAVVAATKASASSEAPPAPFPFRIAASLAQRSTQIVEQFLDHSGKSGTSMSPAALAILLACVALVFFCVVASTLYSNAGVDQDTASAASYQQHPLRESSFPKPSPEATYLSPAQARKNVMQPSSTSVQAKPGSPLTAGLSPPIASINPRGAYSAPAATQHLQQRTMVAPHTAPASMPVPGATAAAMQQLTGGLVLPAVESRFAVALEDLSRAGRDCTLEVVALSGLPLLSMVISNGNRLDIGLAHQGSAPRCSVIAPAEVGGAFIINDPHNKPYGQFRNTGPGYAEVIIEGRTIMIVEGSTNNLQFSVTSTTGKPVALARVNKEDFKGDYLEIRALPGADAILVLSVILALAIFTTSQPPGSSGTAAGSRFGEDALAGSFFSSA